MVDLYSKALALDGPPYWSLQLRATTKMLGRFLDDALEDLKLLEEKQSRYASGIFNFSCICFAAKRTSRNLTLTT